METVKKILREAYQNHGNLLFSDPRRLSALLDDLLYDYPNEKKRLDIIIKEGIASKLVYEKENSLMSKAYMYVNSVSTVYDMATSTSYDLINTFYFAIYGSDLEQIELSKSVISKEQNNINKVLSELGDEFSEIKLKENFSQILQAAENGNPQAQFRIAKCYDEGVVVKKNLNDAKKWYILSAEQGYTSAQINLGNIYYDEHEIDNAIKCYDAALKNGMIVGGYNLGVVYRDLSKATKNHLEIEKYIELSIASYEKALQVIKKSDVLSDEEFAQYQYESAKNGAILCNQYIRLINNLKNPLIKTKDELLAEAMSVIEKGEKSMKQSNALSTIMKNSILSKTIINSIVSKRIKRLDLQDENNYQKAIEYKSQIEKIIESIENFERQVAHYTIKKDDFTKKKETVLQQAKNKWNLDLSTVEGWL